MKGKDEKKVVDKEHIAENWCFHCKDGGDLRICDHKECVKSFHPCCLGEEDSFLESDSHWVCAWHTCFLCHKSSQLHCYTCTNAVCRRCLPAADFSQVKSKYGFCKSCLKLALLIEEEKDYDSEGDKVDFTDLETYEGLFMEYYYIIKKKEGFESRDVYAAREQLKMKNECQSQFDSEEHTEDEDHLSDYEGNEYLKKCKRIRKRKRSEREKPASQTPIKSNKTEFICWASRSLIEFLNSIGKNTDEELSQRDVTSIINEYVKENKLSHQERRKMITCDARLQSLFRRKAFHKNRVYELLEAHFTENIAKSEEDELDYDSEDENAGIPNVCKRQRKLNSENKSQNMELEDNVHQSCFASIVVQNIKLVYLKRSLLRELLKQPETFQEKVIGCFVRVKCNPYEYLASNSHQLMQVEGVKTVPNGENNMEAVLLFSAIPKELPINLLSDGDFSEEECEDLRQKMLAGNLKRPTVEDLQQKAKILHEDMTKHWISKELTLLQHLIERANEKGWRRELFEYWERRKRLRNPSEQMKLLESVPTVIPDLDEQLTSKPADIIDEMNSDKGSPQSILQRNSVRNDGWQDDKASEEKTHRDNKPAPERKQLVSEESAPAVPEHNHTPDSKIEHDKTEMASNDDDEEEEFEGPESEIWCIRGPNGEQEKCSLAVLRRWAQNSRYASQYKAWREDENEEKAVGMAEVVSVALPRKQQQ